MALLTRTTLEPPPTWALPIIVNPHNNQAIFSPIWLRWFLDFGQYVMALNVAGGTGTGTVTSVAVTVPSLLSVAGSPVTTAGTFAITYSGTPLPVANGGTGTVTPALVQGTGVTITGSWPNQTINASAGSSGTVTSVAATVPSIFSVSGSPITASGTLAMTYSGTALPVANGGTGLTTLTSNNVMLGNGTGTPQFVAPSTSGKVLTSNGTTWQATALPATTGVTGTITTRQLTVGGSNGYMTFTNGLLTSESPAT